MTTADLGAGDPGSRESTQPVPRAEFWQRTIRAWTLAFAAGIVLTATSLALQMGGATLVRGLALLALLVLAYLTLGLRAAASGSGALAHAYLAVLVLVTTASTVNAALSVTLLFIAYSQIWFFGPSRVSGVAYTLLLSLSVFGGFALVTEQDDLRGPLVQGLLAAGFSILLGLWVTYIAEQSEVRAAILEELQATRAALEQTAHATGVMAERERMAGEIHDTLAQGFASIVMLAQAAEADIARGEQAQAVERVRLVEATARENLAEARALVAAFAPVGLDGSSLVEALERLAGRFTAETGVSVELELPAGTEGLARENEVVILRVTQEALTNVRRHALASSARVRLELGASGAARLEVSDDGRGIAPEQAEGFGLRGMRERVSASGGSLELDSPPGGGTIVRVSLPGKDAA